MQSLCCKMQDKSLLACTVWNWMMSVWVLLPRESVPLSEDDCKMPPVVCPFLFQQLWGVGQSCDFSPCPHSATEVLSQPEVRQGALWLLHPLFKRLPSTSLCERLMQSRRAWKQDRYGEKHPVLLQTSHASGEQGWALARGSKEPGAEGQSSFLICDAPYESLTEL